MRESLPKSLPPTYDRRKYPSLLGKTSVLFNLNKSIMYYVVKINEYQIFKSDIRLLEVTDTLEKAKALRDAMQAIHPDEKYEVLTAVQ